MQAPMVRFGRMFGVGRWLGVQIAVALVAAIGVSVMFAGGSPPPPMPVVSEGGKSLRRVSHEPVSTTVLQFDPQAQAVRASIANFTPTTAPAVITALPSAAAARAAAPKVVTVMPPRRPEFTPPAVTTVEGPPPVSQPAPQNWRVAGVDIPGSARVRTYVPSGADLLKPADYAWTAGKNAVRKVAGLGSLFGL